MSQQEELKPCPFCGCGMRLGVDAERGYVGPDGNHDPSCMIASISFVDYADERQAVAEWNRRVNGRGKTEQVSATCNDTLQVRLKLEQSSTVAALASRLLDHADTCEGAAGLQEDIREAAAILAAARGAQ